MDEATQPHRIERAIKVSRWFEVSILLFGLLLGGEWQGFIDGRRDAELSSRITTLDESLQESFRRRDDKTNAKIDSLARDLRAYINEATKVRTEILQRVAHMEGNR